VTTSVGPTPYVPDTFRDGTPYSMTVNPANGNLLLAYANYDRSLPRGNIWLRSRVTVQFYAADGTSLGGNRRATLDTWDPNVVPPKPGGLSSPKTFIGDYFGGAMTSTAEGTFAHRLLVSTSPDRPGRRGGGRGVRPSVSAADLRPRACPIAPAEVVARTPPSSGALAAVMSWLPSPRV
jgi:hypothetical protein